MKKSTLDQAIKITTISRRDQVIGGDYHMAETIQAAKQVQYS